NVTETNPLAFGSSDLDPMRSVDAFMPESAVVSPHDDLGLPFHDALDQPVVPVAEQRAGARRVPIVGLVDELLRQLPARFERVGLGGHAGYLGGGRTLGFHIGLLRRNDRHAAPAPFPP